MRFEANNWYHVYNQGNNKQPIFYEKENFLFFLSKIQGLSKQDFNIIAYCLMPNHFHFLIYTNFNSSEEVDKSGEYSRKLGSILSSYAKAMNKRYGRSGSLFRSKTKSKDLSLNSQSSERYVRTCFHYIHQNPLKAGIAKTLSQWPFSSYRDYAGVRNGTLPNVKKGYKMIGFKDCKHFIEQSRRTLDPQLLEDIF